MSGRLDSFREADFVRAVEEGFGVAVKSARALPGRSHSLNYVVVDASGSKCVFKCVPRASSDALKRLFAHAQSVGSGLVPKLLFDGKAVDFGMYRVFAISWMDGDGKPADRLSKVEIASLVERSGELLGSLRDDGFVLPARDLVEVRRGLLERLDPRACGEVYDEVEGMDESSLVRDPARIRIIHGDLNPGNVRFSNGAVSGFIDIEELRFGCWAEDLVRFVVCSAEHVKPFEFWRLRGTRSAFAEMVRIAGIPADEWLLAVNGYLLWKLRRRIKGPRIPLAAKVALKWRLRLYRDLRAIAVKR